MNSKLFQFDAPGLMSVPPISDGDAKSCARELQATLATIHRLELRRDRRFVVAAIELARRKAAGLRGNLVLGFMPLIAYLSRQANRRGLRMPYDEVMSEGYTTLLARVELFDESRGVKFITFAGMVVSRHFLNLFAYQDRPCVRRFTVTDPDCLDRKAAKQGGAERWELASRRLGAVEAAMAGLKPRSRDIIEDLYGLRREVRRCNGARVAKDRGISRERVRQIRDEALSAIAGRITWTDDLEDVG
jgi:RNA polymerase sigma factor (sigma-70 family)